MNHPRNVRFAQQREHAMRDAVLRGVATVIEGAFGMIAVLLVVYLWLGEPLCTP